MIAQSGWRRGPDPRPAWKVALGLGRRGACPALDEDDQLCALRAGHAGSHRSSGVRRWLETTPRDAVIRTYEGPRASDRLVAEGALFAEFGFRPIAHEDATTVERTGPGMVDYLVLGILAGLASSTHRRRRLTVCFHRCGAGRHVDLGRIRDAEPAGSWPGADTLDAEAPWPAADLLDLADSAEAVGPWPHADPADAEAPWPATDPADLAEPRPDPDPVGPAGPPGA